MQQKIEEELQEEELLEDLLHNQQINEVAQGKMSQNSSNETDSKMAKTGKQAMSVNNKKQAAVQTGFGNLVSQIDWQVIMQFYWLSVSGFGKPY